MCIERVCLLSKYQCPVSLLSSLFPFLFPFFFPKQSPVTPPLLLLLTAYEEFIKEQRIRSEVSQVKMENAFYTKIVEKSRAISAIIERKRKWGKEALRLVM